MSKIHSESNSQSTDSKNDRFREPGGTKFEPFNSRFKAFGRSFNFMKLSNFS